MATSTVRDAQVGYWFELNEHPEIDRISGSDKEFLITSKKFYNQNNLPKDLTDQIAALLKQTNWQQAEITTHNKEERQAPNHLFYNDVISVLFQSTIRCDNGLLHHHNARKWLDQVVKKFTWMMGAY